jgi:hypothetical protein
MRIKEDNLGVKISQLKRLVVAPFTCGMRVVHKPGAADVRCGNRADYVLQDRTEGGELEETFVCSHCAIEGLLSENIDLGTELAEMVHQLEIMREYRDCEVKRQEPLGALKEIT